MENLIPDPFNNFRFYQCTPEWAPDQNRYHVFARVKDCAMGPNGEPLAYDIRHCKCMHRDEAVCFNPAIHGNRARSTFTDNLFWLQGRANELQLDLHQPNFPVIILFLNYETTPRHISETKYGRGLGYLACNNEPVELKPNQEYKFIASPPSKQFCFVQFYFNPKSCRTWSHRVLNAYLLDYHFSFLLPKTFLIPAIPYFSNQNPTGRDNINMRVFKSGVYFCHVDLAMPLTISGQSITFSIPFLIDMIWSSGPSMFKISFSVLPTKIGIHLGYSKKLAFFKAKYISLSTCLNYNRIYNRMLNNCLAKKHGYATTSICIHNQLINYVGGPPSVIYMASGITSKEQFQVAYLRSCNEVAIVIEDGNFFGLPIRPYLLDFRGKIADIRQPLLTALCGNCTLLGEIQESELNLGVFNIFPTFGARKSELIQSELYFASTGNLMQFVTCFPTEKPGWLSLIGFIHPFDLNTWLMILVTAVLSGTILVNGSKERVEWFDFVFVYHILLAQGTHVTNNVKWIGGAWLLAGIVLTFFYQGENINRLTAPLPSEKMSNFADLLSANFTIYTPLRGATGLQESIKGLRNWNVERHLYPNFSGKFLFGDLYINKETSRTRAEAIREMKAMLKSPSTFSELIEMLKPNYNPDKISKCGRDAYVDISTNVEKMKSELAMRGVERKILSWSKVAYGEVYDYWSFELIPFTAEWFLGRARGLFQSGIVRVWHEWERRVVLWKETLLEARGPKEIPYGLSLDGNIAVVFLLHFILLCIPFIVFIVEARVYVKELAKLLWCLISSIIIYFDRFLRRIWHAAKNVKILNMGHVEFL
ncbi:unnamed protein product [Orchesella dallaii]|uniref:Meckelin n=1 Tax=Orchesella dallaii TaxID=48710 RepID=A0ABP1Q324_9HEXA